MTWLGDIVLACGHRWPGECASEAEARQFFELCKATGDTVMCRSCGSQEAVVTLEAR